MHRSVGDYGGSSRHHHDPNVVIRIVTKSYMIEKHYIGVWSYVRRSFIHGDYEEKVCVGNALFAHEIFYCVLTACRSFSIEYKKHCKGEESYKVI